MNTKMLLALSAVIVVFIMAGQVVTYWVNPYHYDADAVISDGNIIFNINAPSSEYSVVAYDNGGFEPVTEIYVFIDAGYCSGQSLSDQRTFLNQLERELSVRGSSPPTEVNADELRTLMSEPGSGKGILMLSGAFPDTVYSGNSGDPVFSWLDSMGSIYWMNGKIGRSVSHD
ncbi:MAG: hypothetical protein FWG60_00475, partial [Methanomassiliicoccaceae archaeon]|nr:hypothetical protein [Methanomassiliicoccaceae archaeon]